MQPPNIGRDMAWRGIQDHISGNRDEVLFFWKQPEVIFDEK
jgi:hypothetical protein